MTSTLHLTAAQLRDRGYQALLRELGPVDFVRFVQQFEPGNGDYTHDRQRWLGQLTPEQVNQVIDERRRMQQGK